MAVQAEMKSIDDRWLGKTQEYRLIKEFYDDQRAKRSGVPYINHIIEGCAALWAMTGVESADVTVQEAREMQRAFCLHPFAQNSLKEFTDLACKHELHQRLIIWAADYAAIARQFLTVDLPHYPTHPPRIVLSQIREVNLMLLADKIQNYKDLRHYNSLLPNYAALNYYFEHWISELCDHLDVSHEDVLRYERAMLA